MKKILLLSFPLLFLMLSNIVLAECSENYTLDSTANQCHNSTDYKINTTYYDEEECDVEYPFMSNYTYHPITYNLSSITKTCLNSFVLQTTYQNETFGCTNPVSETCKYNCRDGDCQTEPFENYFTIIGIGFLIILFSVIMGFRKGKMTDNEKIIELIIIVLILGLLFSMAVSVF